MSKEFEDLLGQYWDLAHMKMCGLPHWPEWADKEPTSAHLTKGGAQDWLRHLFALEQSANQLDDIDVVDMPAQQQELQTCKCRWEGEVQVQQCTLHEAHVDAIHEWAERAKSAEHQFKNFHRLLCERFGYTHDERDWRRDQLSLIEWIAKRAKQPAQQRRISYVCPQCHWSLDEQPAQQEPVRVPVTDNTYNYAKSLAEAIFKQHFASDEHYSSGRIVWGVNDTVIDILTQIDNMVADMVRKPAPAQRKPLPGWIAVSDRIPLESDGEVLVRMRDGRCEIAWATYWHGASNAFAQWTFRDPDEDEAPTHWMHIPTIEAAHGIKENT